MISIENKGNGTIFKVTGEVTANEILMQLAHHLSNLTKQEMSLNG